MSIIVECAGCKNQFYAPPAAAGKIARCPQCSQKINIPSPSPSVAVPSRPASAPSKKSAAASPSARSSAPNANASTSSSAKPNANEHGVGQGQPPSQLRFPQVSRGMRWFLIIVVVPIAIIYLLGQVLTPLFRSSPVPTTSGSFGASSEERDALLQQLAEEEQKKLAGKTTPGEKPTAKQTSPVLLVMNGDTFEMTTDDFKDKYRGYYQPGIYLDLRRTYDGGGGNIEESYHYYPARPGWLEAGNIPAFSWTYHFLNHKLVKLNGLIKTDNSAALIVTLNKYFKSSPKEITEYKKFLEPGDLDVNDTRPQLRWENDQLRITLTPTVADCYDYEVVENSKANREALLAR